MVKEIRIYFEGAAVLREGFGEFLKEIRDKARARRIGFEFIACGGAAKRDFEIGSRRNPQAWNVLLCDSEGDPVPSPPPDSKFWMVELMEAWFLADPEALQHYYGAEFNRKALKKNPDVEKIRKVDVKSCLDEATKGTQKGRYNKTKHAPHLLMRISPQKVRKHARNCERLFQSLGAKIEGR